MDWQKLENKMLPPGKPFKAQHSRWGFSLALQNKNSTKDFEVFQDRNVITAKVKLRPYSPAHLPWDRWACQKNPKILVKLCNNPFLTLKGFT